MKININVERGQFELETRDQTSAMRTFYVSSAYIWGYAKNIGHGGDTGGGFRVFGSAASVLTDGRQEFSEDGGEGAVTRQKEL